MTTAVRIRQLKKKKGKQTIQAKKMNPTKIIVKHF
jgi:hypothetical protein